MEQNIVHKIFKTTHLHNCPAGQALFLLKRRRWNYVPKSVKRFIFRWSDSLALSKQSIENWFLKKRFYKGQLEFLRGIEEISYCKLLLRIQYPLEHSRNIIFNLSGFQKIDPCFLENCLKIQRLPQGAILGPMLYKVTKVSLEILIMSQNKKTQAHTSGTHGISNKRGLRRITSGPRESKHLL